MKYNIIGRKVNLRDNFKERVYKKLGKFEKIYSEDAEARDTCHRYRRGYGRGDNPLLFGLYFSLSADIRGFSLHRLF